MSSNLLDPNNHVPEVSPSDDWGDAVDWQDSSTSTVRMLPARRTPKSDTAAPANSLGGIKIEPTLAGARDTASAGNLDVREISGHVVRLTPEDTTELKVPRHVVFREKPLAPPKNPEAEGHPQWGQHTRKSHRWLVISGVAVISLVIAGLLLLQWLNQTDKTHIAQHETQLIVDPEEERIDGIAALNDLLTRQPQAEQIFRSFASASIVDDFLPAVRDSNRLAPIIRKAERSVKLPKEWLPSQDCLWNVFESDGKPCAELQGRLPNQKTFTACFIVENNKLLLDWKATTGYGTASFENLEQGQGDGTEIRGWLGPTNFHTALFPEKDFNCYQLLSPERDHSVWCYVAADSPQGSQLAKLFPQGLILEASSEPVKVTLQLARGPANSLANQWLIGKMLHKDWISP